MQPQPDKISLTLASGLSADVWCAGEGASVVFLHGRTGRAWDSYLQALAQSYRVYVPLHPGVADASALDRFDHLGELAIYYDDLFRALEIASPIIIGHGFGGMVALEYAAYFNAKVDKLVLIGTLGLWRDDEPIGDLDAVQAIHLREHLFKDPAGRAAEEIDAVPDDPMAQAQRNLEQTAVIAAVNHFIWPIPDRRLRRRLYRVQVPTLLLWGADDAYVPSVYGADMHLCLDNSRLRVLPNAGHFCQLEQLDAAVRHTKEFIARPTA